jgi:hypothetical protein
VNEVFDPITAALLSAHGQLGAVVFAAVPDRNEYF